MSLKDVVDVADGVAVPSSFSLELRVDRHLLAMVVDCHRELARVGNNDIDIGLVAGSWGVLNLSHDVHTLNNLAENDVAAIEPVGFDSADKELGAIGILASVSHGEDTGASVAELEVLILEAVTIDRLATSAVWLVKSPPWIMNALMTRWKVEPLYP